MEYISEIYTIAWEGKRKDNKYHRMRREDVQKAESLSKQLKISERKEESLSQKT